MASRPSSNQSVSTTATYFDYRPSSCDVSPLKPRKTNVHTLDAFHHRPSTPFEYPPNASLYEKRALPPLPPLSALPALSKCCSTESLCSGPPSSRPSTAMTNRESCEKSLPPLPSLHQCPSLESMTGKPAELSRPRTHRGMSFRGLLNRQSASSTSTEDVPSLTSSVNSRDSRTDSVVGDYSLTRISTSGTAISSAPGSRRPSTLSLTQLRAASKKVNSAAAPPLPTTKPTGRKHSSSVGNSHRWNPFRNSEEDKEDIPPMPVTPPFVKELSFGQCYYFFARNCNGYVLSNGANGDACENCANAGYLGSP